MTTTDKTVVEVRQRVPKYFWWTLIMVVIGVVGAASVSIFYADYKVYQSEQAWCAVIQPLDVRYHQIGHPDKDQADFAGRMHNLVVKYHCKEE
jgi:hypothetical protein